MISEKLKAFTVEKNISIIDALQKMDQNKKGLLIVTDSGEAVLGTLTDVISVELSSRAFL